MNFGVLFGFLLSFVITAYAILTSSDDKSVFLDEHGIVIVIGGTITVALLCFPMKQLYSSFKVFLKDMFVKQKIDYQKAITTIVELSEAYRVDPKNLRSKLSNDAHPMLKDGITLLVDYGFSYEKLDEILSNAVKGQKVRNHENAKVWQTVSRFPPAFGLLGATVGMIALLQTIGSDGAQDRIGPAMATALVATFYGLVLANFFLIPISEKLTELGKEDIILRSILHEGILMIHQKEHPLYIEEYLKSFLSPAIKKKMKSSRGSVSSGQRAA